MPVWDCSFPLKGKCLPLSSLNTLMSMMYNHTIGTGFNSREESKKMKKSLVLLSVMVFFTCMCVASSTEIVMLFGVYPPFYMMEGELDETVAKGGIFIDFLEEFLKEYPQYEFTFQVVSRIRMDRMMDSGEAQAFSLNNPMFMGDSAENFLFTDPIFHTRDAVITRADDPFVYTKPEDLYGKNIGVILGYGYGEFDALFAEGKIKTNPVNSFPQLYRLLLSGRIDAFFGNIHVNPYDMILNDFDPSLFQFSEESIFSFDLMTVINKAYTHFRDDMNQFIQKSKDSGLLEELVDRYTR